MAFRFLDHTADVQAECRAATFEQLLETAAGALYAIAIKDVRSSAGVERMLEVSGTGREELLVRWLQELIYLMDVKRFVATEFDFERADSRVARACLGGYIHDPGARAEEVKGATYHELELRETDDGFLARVIFDL